MSRIRRFISNAGLFGTVQALVVSLGVAGMIAASILDGGVEYTIPGVLAALAIAWGVRGPLVEHVQQTRWLMNLCAVAGIVAVAVFRERFDFESNWFRGLFPAALALYLGCYVLLLSDPRIGRAD